jgi:hypothetical protein
MIYPIDIPIAGQTSVVLLAGVLTMAIAAGLFVIAYAALLNNCGRKGLIDDNADSFIVLSVIIEVIGFMMIVIGASL